MPGEYAIPNWIQPADEAGHYARGLQLGAQIGEAQAAQLQQQHQMELAQQKNQFAQQMELRDQQLKANQDARAQAELGLRAAEAARKTEGMMEYQRRVQAGEDPMKVILDVGPKIGLTGPTLFSAMRNQAQFKDQQAQQSAAPDVQDLPNGYKVARWGKREFLLHPNTPKPVAQWSTQMRDDGQGNQYPVQVNSVTGEERAAPRPPATGKITQIDRDELHEMEHDLEKLETAHEKDLNGQMASTADPKTLTPGRKAVLDAYNARKLSIDKLSQEIDQTRARIRGGGAQQQTPKAAPKSKVARAKELSKAHPEWNKQQVIDAVNQEYAATSPQS